MSHSHVAGNSYSHPPVQCLLEIGVASVMDSNIRKTGTFWHLRGTYKYMLQCLQCTIAGRVAGP